MLKSGHIKLISAFEFPLDSESEFFWRIIFSSPLKDIKHTYSLTDEDLSKLKELKEWLEIPQYLKLAFNLFIEYYNIEDEKLRFVMLTIALESIFNVSKDLNCTYNFEVYCNSFCYAH